MEEKGLIQKYIVFKADDQTIITDCFMLRPEKELGKGSKAAVAAIRAYAKATENKQLADDLNKWMDDIEGSMSTGMDRTLYEIEKLSKTGGGSVEIFGIGPCAHCGCKTVIPRFGGLKSNFTLYCHRCLAQVNISWGTNDDWKKSVARVVECWNSRPDADSQS